MTGRADEVEFYVVLSSERSQSKIVEYSTDWEQDVVLTKFNFGFTLKPPLDFDEKSHGSSAQWSVAVSNFLLKVKGLYLKTEEFIELGTIDASGQFVASGEKKSISVEFRDSEDILHYLTQLFRSADAELLSGTERTVDYRFKLTVGNNWALRISSNICSFLNLVSPILPSGAVFELKKKKFDFNVKRDWFYPPARLNIEELLVKQNTLLPEALTLEEAGGYTARVSSLLDVDLASMLINNGWKTDGTNFQFLAHYLDFMPVTKGLIHRLSISLSHAKSGDLITCEKSSIGFNLVLKFRRRLMLTLD